MIQQCGGAMRNGVRVCKFHDMPLLDWKQAKAVGIPEKAPPSLNPQYCPVSAIPLAGFEITEDLHDELGNG